MTETAEVVGRFEQTLKSYNDGPFANYLPHTELTGKLLAELAAF